MRQQPPPDPRVIAAIEQAMLVQHVTRTELAERIGWSQPNVSTYLSGRRDVSTRTLRKIADALGLDIDVKKAKKKRESV